MIIIRKKTVGLILILVLLYLGFITGRYLNKPRIRIGDRIIKVNYRAKMNPQKNYRLQLWDYNWPGFEEAWYRKYLQAVIKRFEKERPNIKVELILLDLMEGPQQLAKALASGTAPDVYCSAYSIPEFNYQWQIPAGIFLKPKELERYSPNIRALVTLEGYLLALPRWVVPGIWVGNRSLMEKAGFSIEKIQKYGWSWADLTDRIIPRPFCAGNFSANGMLPQLLLCGPQKDKVANVGNTLDFISNICGPYPQKPESEAGIFEKFFSGKVMLLAGVRPAIFSFIKQRLIESGVDWQPVPLPVPCRYPGQRITPVECGVICIYRNRKSDGDDQLAAAASLAYFLSNSNYIGPWLNLKVVPAVSSLAQVWVQSSVMNDYGKTLTNWLTGVELVNLEENPGYNEAVYPVLNGFFTGKASRRELEEIVLNNYYPN